MGSSFNERLVEALCHEIVQLTKTLERVKRVDGSIASQLSRTMWENIKLRKRIKELEDEKT
jgi:hypothetical protein